MAQQKLFQTFVSVQTIILIQVRRMRGRLCMLAIEILSRALRHLSRCPIMHARDDAGGHVGGRGNRASEEVQQSAAEDAVFHVRWWQ